MATQRLAQSCFELNQFIFYTEFHSQRNFIFSSQFSRLIIIWKILWFIIIYIPSLSFCIIKSGFYMCMRGYLHSKTKVPFPCCTWTCWYFFKNIFTINFLEDRSVSVCKVKCLKFQRNARNLDWLSVPVHRTFLRNRHHCTKRSTPLWTAVARVLYFVKTDGRIEEKV